MSVIEEQTIRSVIGSHDLLAPPVGLRRASPSQWSEEPIRDYLDWLADWTERLAVQCISRHGRDPSEPADTLLSAIGARIVSRGQPSSDQGSALSWDASCVLRECVDINIVIAYLLGQSRGHACAAWAIVEKPNSRFANDWLVLEGGGALSLDPFVNAIHVCNEILTENGRHDYWMWLYAGLGKTRR